ncbi:hypothetical protein VTK73DRAFT_7199 [Phialemonium thermophilum]|uniref:Uncharacterized protein n=1 Tax=Phialemonium thermophilum TaxID=223376 RepID=A0ABR3WFV7_9PEZI
MTDGRSVFRSPDSACNTCNTETYVPGTLAPGRRHKPHGSATDRSQQHFVNDPIMKWPRTRPSAKPSSKDPLRA